MPQHDGPNSRLYHRFKVNHPELAYVTEDGRKLGTINELAYGGFMLRSESPSIRAVSEVGANGSGVQEIVVLHLFGKSLLCRAERMHEAQGRLGYRFIHERAELLPFLKEVLVFLKLGAGRRYQDDKFIDNSKGLPDNLMPDPGYRLVVKSGAEGTDGLPSVTAEIHVDRIVYQLVCDGEKLNTLHSVWPGARGGELRETESLDFAVFRMGLACLVGYASGDYQSTYGKVVEKILRLYRQHLAASVGDLKKRASR